MSAFKMTRIHDSENPWPEEFRPYAEEEAEFFFGRDSDCAIITASLLSYRISVLHGRSGVGKSSVMSAGVLPEFKRDAGLIAPGARTPICIYNRDWPGDPCLTVQDAVRDAVTLAGFDPPGESQGIT